jgi:hypothetical protein
MAPKCACVSLLIAGLAAWLAPLPVSPPARAAPLHARGFQPPEEAPASLPKDYAAELPGEVAASQPASAPAGPVVPPGFEAAGRKLDVSQRATFLLSPHRQPPEEWLLIPDLFRGMRGFEHFYEPLGNPFYFESPFIASQVRVLFLWHKIPDRSALGGGDFNQWIPQFRLALSDRLALMITKGGYVDLNAERLRNDEGVSEFGWGLKYALWVDEENQFVLTSGLRWHLDNGGVGRYQSGTQELSPFISLAKGFDRLHIIGNFAGRIPMDRNRGNYAVLWDAHVDYEIAPQTLPGLAPTIEVRGMHFVSDAERFPTRVSGLDYANLGASDVAGTGTVSAGIGFRWKLTPNASLGSMWEFPLHDAHNDNLASRVVVDLSFSW